MKALFLMLSLFVTFVTVATYTGSSIVISSAYANETTPSMSPADFESVKSRSGKRHKKTLEIWELDKLHKTHWEVYKNLKDYDNGKRNRAVWDDGRPKETF